MPVTACLSVVVPFINYFVFVSFLKGDMFIVHNEHEDGWMWVTNVRTNEQGLIVDDLVEEVVSVFLSRL